jgi:aspartate aminotransferase-like enzyme
MAHLGYCAESDVLAAVSALEMTLKEMGYPTQPGAAASAAESALMRNI